MGDPLAVPTKFAEAVVASGLDVDVSAASGPGNAMLDAGLEKSPMGELPEANDRDVPSGRPAGHHDRFPGDGRNFGRALRRRRRRKARATDVHWRLCRINMYSTHGVWDS
jgi:hypothetical protein